MQSILARIFSSVHPRPEIGADAKYFQDSIAEIRGHKLIIVEVILYAEQDEARMISDLVKAIAGFSYLDFRKTILTNIILT